MDYLKSDLTRRVETTEHHIRLRTSLKLFSGLTVYDQHGVRALTLADKTEANSSSDEFY